MLYDGDTYDLAEVDSLWRLTARPMAAFPTLRADIRAEVAIVGGGITGLSAALHLARDHGATTVLLEAGPIGWGASGRNGGFCVPGGDRIGASGLARRYGLDEARRYVDLTLAAVGRVSGLLRDEAIEAEPQPGGELTLAHSPRALDRLQRERDDLIALHGHRRDLLSTGELREQGLASAHFGGLLEPVGFGLHPLDYVRGLARAAARRGAAIHPNSAVIGWRREGPQHHLSTAEGCVIARKVILATGGYPPEALEPAIGGRVLPILSNIMATRHLTLDERAAQGWTSTQAACDSRALLHYFRLLPDGRFLFGGRGGLGGGSAPAAAFRARLAREFRATFPAWDKVEITHYWRGLVDLSADGAPHCAALAGDPSVLIGCAYHGSGVSMGTEVGAQLALLAAGRDTPDLPGFMHCAPPRFPLPGLRKLYLAGGLAAYGWLDRVG